MSISDMDHWSREQLAKLYRTHERGLSAFLESERHVDPEINKTTARLADLFVEKADELWPRPIASGTWVVETHAEHPGILVIKTRAKGDGQARIWLREAAGLAYAIKQHSKHEVAQSGGTT